MGTILGSKLKGEGKIIFEVLMDYEEALQLEGNMNNVHLFSDDVVHHKASISTRGKDSITKYLLIPRELRRNLDLSKEISCQKISLKHKTFFIYAIDKL